MLNAVMQVLLVVFGLEMDLRLGLDQLDLSSAWIFRWISK